MSSPPLLEVRDLEVAYGDVVAVRGVSLDLPAHRLTALVGPSGCGKTTLLRAIAGFERPRAGRIRLGGRLLSGRDGWVEPEHRQVGMVFQDGALFPHLTVAGNVAYGLAGDGAGRVAEVLELVDLAELGGRYPDELSGGQQQRVALARALAPEPRLVLLDEPFASLDATLRERLRRDVRRILEAAGVTALLVTHDQQEALSVADRVAVMVDGQVLQVGPPDRVYRRPATPGVARFLGDGVLVPCQVAGGFAVCRFGRVPTAEPPGPARLFVRPEDLAIEPSPAGEGDGRVVDRRFFGHDVLDRVRLTGGEEIEVRNPSSLDLPAGSSVRLSLRTDREYTLFRA